MRARGLLHLARLDLRADWKGAALNACAACVGAAALAFFVALGGGVGEAARRMFPGETRLVEVVPSSVSLGAALGGGVLDEEAVARLAAVEGVAAAFRKLNLRVPVSASRPPEGVAMSWPEGVTVQVPVMGVDPGLVLDPGRLLILDQTGATLPRYGDIRQCRQCPDEAGKNDHRRVNNRDSALGDHRDEVRPVLTDG